MSMCESLLTKDIIRYFLIRGILNDFATFLDEAFMPQGVHNSVRNVLPCCTCLTGVFTSKFSSFLSLFHFNQLLIKLLI